MSNSDELFKQDFINLLERHHLGKLDPKDYDLELNFYLTYDVESKKTTRDYSLYLSNKPKEKASSE